MALQIDVNDKVQYQFEIPSSHLEQSVATPKREVECTLPTFGALVNQLLHA